MNKSKLDLRNVVAIAVCLVGMAMFSGCDKEELPEIDSTKFCLYANMEDFHKTAPLVNGYLNALPKKWNDEQKVQALANWLNTAPCVTVVDFVVIPNWCWTPPVYQAASVEIKILLDDNGVKKEIILDIVKEVESNLFVATGYRYTKPKTVVVGTSYNINVSTKQIFEFVNLFDHEVTLIEMYTGAYTSNMSSSSLQNILDDLNAKSYVRVHGFIDEGRIIIIPWLHNMDNKDYQADWIETMSEYNLYEWNRYSIWHGFAIRFEVSEGTEIEWVAKFQEYEIISTASRVLQSVTF